MGESTMQMQMILYRMVIEMVKEQRVLIKWQFKTHVSVPVWMLIEMRKVKSEF